MALFGLIVEFLFSLIRVSFVGAYKDSSPREHGPPLALAGMPGHAQSPQIKKAREGSFLGTIGEVIVKVWEAL